MFKSKVMKSWDVEDENCSFVLSSVGDLSDQEYDPSLAQKSIDLLIQAKKEAERIVDLAYMEGYEQGKKRGYQEGQIDGFREGRSEGLKKTEDEYRQALKLAYNIENMRKELMLEWEQDVKKLAVVIGEKIINTKLNMDEEIIVQITKKALDSLVSPKWVNLYVNPRDGENLIKHRKNLFEEISGEIPLKIIKTPDLPVGSCHMETDKGNLDASIPKQILEVKKALEIA